MKKARYIQVFFIFALFFALITVTRADEMTNTQVQAHADTSVSATADATDVPVILPTNPFYFAKEFARGVRLFFTFGKVNKASYQLEVVDQKALEVKEVEKLNPENTVAIKKALDNYTNDVANLKPKIEALANTSTDPRVTTLLTNLTDQAVSHAALFQDLKTNDAVRASVDQAESTVTATVTAAASKIDAPQAAQALIEKVTQASATAPTAIKAAATVDQATLINAATTISATAQPVQGIAIPVAR